jgi:hypothetical protein
LSAVQPPDTAKLLRQLEAAVPIDGDIALAMPGSGR